MAGAMDLEDQWKINRLIRDYGKDNLVVLLGCPDAESSQIQAETVSIGDPSMVGPLANQHYLLPVVHAIEPFGKKYSDLTRINFFLNSISIE